MVATDLSSQLAQERRARLAAERLLAQRQTELREVNRRLERQTVTLAGTLIETRAEAQSRTATLQSDIGQAQAERDDAARAMAAAEERLWQALQIVRDGFALFDADHRLVIANPAYLSIFDGMEAVAPGIDYAEICEILLSEGIVDPQGPPGDWLSMMKARWQDKTVAPVTLRLWNGTFVELTDKRTPEGGMVTRGVDTTDLTRIRAAIEAIPGGFVLFDADDRMSMCNERYREIYSISAPAIVPGAQYEDILRYGLARGQYGTAIGREEEWFEDAVRTHREGRGVTEMPLVEGRWIRKVERATPDGGRVGLRIDITDMKAQQQALECERARAEAASRAKSVFLANMSHEIRTPMNGVLGMADHLFESETDATRRDCLDTIRDSSRALLRILDDLLDFSRLEAGRMDLRSRPFDLRACIGDVIRLLDPQAVAKSLDLSAEYDARLPDRLVGDAGRVRQIVLNLVGNAIKFTDAGGVAVRVAVADDRVRITVKDTGIGIPEDKQSHVLGAFTQVDQDSDRPHDGTGLGLAICRELAELMGGGIELRSTARRGTSVTVDLPLDVVRADPTARTAPPDAEAATSPAPAKVRILAAEDNATNRLVIGKLLQSAGIELSFANDGAEAVEACRDDPPDLVLMDISMPGMDGLEATRRIREIEEETGRPRLPIAAMTAHAMAEDRERILAAGLDHYLTKPLGRAQLFEVIDRVTDGGPVAPAAFAGAAVQGEAGPGGPVAPPA